MSEKIHTFANVICTSPLPARATINMNRKKKRKDKFANWLLDIAKYITTAVIITSIFEGIENRIYLLIAGVAVVGASLGWGMLLIQDDDSPKRKKG